MYVNTYTFTLPVSVTKSQLVGDGQYVFQKNQ